jgi:superfamily II DNA or RNA helicase
MAHLHNVIQPKWILGLTATPFRTDRVKLCFDKVVKDAGIHQLIQDEYLSRYDHYTIPKWDVPQLADFYCAEPERWGKSIFFFHTLGECFALNQLLQSRGIISDVITGSSDRDAQLAAFRNGEIQVLVNCMVLTEGFDDPSLQTVWIRPSAKGPTIQMAGRALRKYESIPAKQIVQCNQTPHPFPKTAMCRQQYLWQSGEWRSLKINPKLNLCNANVRRAIACTEVMLPKFLKRDDGQRRRRVVRF